MNDPISTGGARYGHKSEAAGQGGAKDEATRFTRCPYCQAVFRVGRNKLDVRQGEVRCGACREVFNALSYQVIRNERGVFESVESAVGAPDPATPESDSSYPDNADQDTGIANEVPDETGSPAQDEDEETNRKTPVFTDVDAPVKLPSFTSGTEIPDSGERRAPRLDAVEEDPQTDDDYDPAEEDAEPDSPETGTSRQNWFSVEPDPLLDHNPFAVKRDGDSEEKDSPEETTQVTQAPSGQLSMQGVDQFIKDRKNPLVTVFWTLVAVGFVLLLGFQVKYYFVERFAGDERYRPWLSGFCKVAGCELPPRTDSYRFTITNTRIDLHPSEPGALRITVKLLNQAEFSQPYPVLQLTLTDRLGRVVGRRSFDPSLYLDSERSDLLDSGELETVMFDLAHPHEKAVGFVVDVVRSPNNV